MLICAARSTTTFSGWRSPSTTAGRTGDLITRVTSDIEVIQDFINSALLGMLVNVMTIVGMIGVMLALNWRFTLIALSVVPVLFLMVFTLHEANHRRPRVKRSASKKRAKLLSVVEWRSLTSIRVVKVSSRQKVGKITRRSDSSLRAWPTSKPAALRPGSIKSR